MICLLVLFLAATTALAQPPDTLWTRTYGEPGISDEARAVTLTNDGGFALACTGVYDLLRADSTGDVLWSREYVGDFFDVTATDDGGFVLAGVLDIDMGWHANAYLLRVDQDGDSVWGRNCGIDLDSIGYYPWSQLHAVAQADDGGFVATGFIEVQVMWYGMYVVRMNPDGDTLWTYTRGGNFYNEVGNDVTVGPGGVVYAAGYSTAAGHRMLGLRLSDDGVVLGSITHTWSDAWSAALAIAVREDGSYLLGGTEYTPWDPQTSVYVAHITAHDSVQSAHRAGFLADDEAYDIKLISDGGYITAGYSDSYGLPGMYIVKFDPAGEVEWERVVNQRDVASASELALYPSGEILVAGFTTEYQGDTDAFVAKLAAPTQAERPLAPHPSSFTLSAYPNPFNATTLFSFTLPHPSSISLALFDILGRRVSDVAHGEFGSGQHTIRYSAEQLGSGIYFARLETPTAAITRKLVTLK